ncbi:hypothetical protein [Pseudomonas sp. MF6396]|uniref:hypothetical protein n=1 Tax=Pseudomonas sp. MF6396 TaxID=1960828 RepID=UPI001EE75A82|nr:hypothetical protein [Pseudomonas sp. MF6396]
MTLHTPPAFDALLVAAPPKVSAEQAQAVAAQYFGLHGACRLLTGERDLNFQITCADGAQYLLKVSNAAEDPQVADSRTRRCCTSSTATRPWRCSASTPTPAAATRSR